MKSNSERHHWYDLSSTITLCLLQDCAFILRSYWNMLSPYNSQPLCFGNETIYIPTSLVGPKLIHCLTVKDDRDKAGIRT